MPLFSLKYSVNVILDFGNSSVAGCEFYLWYRVFFLLCQYIPLESPFLFLSTPNKLPFQVLLLFKFIELLLVIVSVNFDDELSWDKV